MVKPVNTIKTFLTQNISKRQLFFISGLGIVTFIAIVIISMVKNIHVLFPFIIILFPVIFFYKYNSIRLSYLHIALALLFFIELITTLFSSFFFNSISSLIRLVVLIFLFVLYKIILKEFKFLSVIPFLFFFLSSFLLVVSIGSFYSFKNSLTTHGFLELNNFKNLYWPLGLINSRTTNNVWGSALLIFIPLNAIFLLHQKNKAAKILIIISLLLNTFSIIVTFSRGVYLGLFVFVLLFNLLSFKFLKIKKLIVWNVIALLFLSSFAFLVKESFLTTVSISKTTSQQRSTSGRLIIWENGIKMAKEKPLFGYGQKNYRLARKKNPFFKEDVKFFDKTSNTYLQLLIERGILGYSFYVLFFLLITGIVYKNLKDKERSKNEKIELILIFSGIMAFLFREITFSSFFESDFIYFLSFYLLFGLVPFDIEIKEISMPRNRRNAIFIVGLLLVSALTFLNARRTLMVFYNNKFVESYFNNDISKSIKLIDRALKISPSNIELNNHKALALTKNSFNIKISERFDHLLSVEGIKKDSLHKALIYFQKMMVSEPLDDVLFHNMGWVYFALGNKEMSKYYFDKTLEQNPYESMYYISSLLFKIHYSNFENVPDLLSKALMYSPNILESRFYYEFEKKYPELAIEAKQQAKNELTKRSELESNFILKARLARLLLNENPNEALKLLNEVTAALPNLNRPWIYLGYLNYTCGNTYETDEYFEKALFLNSRDYLTKLYCANYLKWKANDEKAVLMFKSALKSYELFKTVQYTKNSGIANFDIIKTSSVISDLTYCLKPSVNALEIFKYFETYYADQNKPELTEYYSQLALKYENKIFKGNEEIR